MEAERKKFVVFKANIMDEEGQKRRDGDVVELGTRLARHYGKLGYLRPFFEEGEDDEPDEEEPASKVGAAKAKFARSRRVAAKSETAGLPSSYTEK